MAARSGAAWLHTRRPPSRRLPLALTAAVAAGLSRRVSAGAIGGVLSAPPHDTPLPDTALESSLAILSKRMSH